MADKRSAHKAAESKPAPKSPKKQQSPVASPAKSTDSKVKRGSSKDAGVQKAKDLKKKKHQSSDEESDDESINSEELMSKMPDDSNGSEEIDHSDTDSAVFDAGSNVKDDEGGNDDESDDDSDSSDSDDSHPPSKHERSSPKSMDREEGAKVYVGNLPYSVTTEKLESFFSECGKIKDVEIGSKNGKPMGIAFVTFASPSGAHAAIAMNGTEIDGRAIKVEISGKKSDGGFGGDGGNEDPCDKLYINNLPFTKSEDDLRELLEEHGAEVENVKIPVHQDSGNPRGFAIVKLSSVENAMAVISKLDGYNWEGRDLRVRYSRPIEGSGGSRGDWGGRGRGGDRFDRGRGGDRFDRGRGGDRFGRGRGDRGGRGRGDRFERR